MNKTALIIIGISCAVLGLLITIGIFIYTAIPDRTPGLRTQEITAQPFRENTSLNPVPDLVSPTMLAIPADAEPTSNPITPAAEAAAPETTGLTPDAKDEAPGPVIDAAKTPAPQKTIPELIQQLQDPDARVRRQAISSLEKLKSKESIPDIKKLLADPNPQVRRQAEKALRKLGVPEKEIEDAKKK